MKKNLFKIFKHLIREIDTLLQNPKLIKSLRFNVNDTQYRELDICKKMHFEWKYPDGDLIIYDPDSILDMIKNRD